jgi:hypothetical protein
LFCSSSSYLVLLRGNAIIIIIVTIITFWPETRFWPRNMPVHEGNMVKHSQIPNPLTHIREKFIAASLSDVWVENRRVLELRYRWGFLPSTRFWARNMLSGATCLNSIRNPANLHVSETNALRSLCATLSWE